MHSGFRVQGLFQGVQPMQAGCEQALPSVREIAPGVSPASVLPRVRKGREPLPKKLKPEREPKARNPKPVTR